MALFLSILGLFLLFADFLFLCLDLCLDLGTLLGGKTLLLVSLLLTLSWGQVVRRGLSRASPRGARLFCRHLTWTLSELVSLIKCCLILVAVIEILLTLSLFVCHGGLTIGGCIGCLLLSRSNLSSIIGRGCIKRGKFAKLSIADLTVGIMVTPAENSFDIFTSGEETVTLEVRDQVGHSDGVVTASD